MVLEMPKRPAREGGDEEDDGYRASVDGNDDDDNVSTVSSDSSSTLRPPPSPSSLHSSTAAPPPPSDSPTLKPVLAMSDEDSDNADAVPDRGSPPAHSSWVDWDTDAESIMMYGGDGSRGRGDSVASSTKALTRGAAPMAGSNSPSSSSAAEVQYGVEVTEPETDTETTTNNNNNNNNNNNRTSNRWSNRSSLLADLVVHELRHLATGSSLGDVGVQQQQQQRPQSLSATSWLGVGGGSSTLPSRHPSHRSVRPTEPAIREEDDNQSFEMRAPGEEQKQEQGEEEEGQKEDADDGYLTGIPLLLLIVGLSLVVLLISTDRTIITTAIPYITADFQSSADIGWYGSSYLLTACAFQPVFGRVFTLFDAKWSYLFSMLVFELGSIVSGWAPNSPCLIVGRAITGFGCAGILTGSFVIVATAVPLSVRPIYTAVVGLMFGVGATIGPLIGGVFTELLSWRWCFWINLPVGAVTIVVMFVIYHPRPLHDAANKPSFMARFVQLDLVGNVIVLAAAIMLFLALEYTLTGVPWGSAKIVGLLAGAGVTAGSLVAWLWWRQDGGLIPPAIVKQRTVAASCLMAFFNYGALLIQTYFLPIWFQAILGYSAIRSGLAMIPYFVSNALFSLLSGTFVSYVGYFAPPALAGSAVGCLGCALVAALFHRGMGAAAWAGIEVLAAAGFGMSTQQGYTAVQTVLRPAEVAVGTAAVVAAQSLGGALFLSVGNAVFQKSLTALLRDARLPGVDPERVIAAGAAGIRDGAVPHHQLPAVLHLYNLALRNVFYVAIPSAGLALLACLALEWRSVKKPPPPGAKEDGESGVGKE